MQNGGRSSLATFAISTRRSLTRLGCADGVPCSKNMPDSTAQVSELYDNLKYDALHKCVSRAELPSDREWAHSRTFLEAIFQSAKERKEAEKLNTHSRHGTSSSSSNATSPVEAVGDGVPSKLKQLYLRAKELFDLSALAARRRHIGRRC
jgi:hypothetical protein